MAILMTSVATRVGGMRVGAPRRSASTGASRQVTTCAKKCRVAINGFGRIGRVKQASHLLKYDSTMGTFGADVKITGDDSFTINGKEIKVVSNRDPTQLPWGAMDIDIVIEGTGVFIDEKGASKHLEAGAKKVLITAPAKGDGIPTYVVGVNEENYSHSDNIVSNASCTTNCLAPFVKVLDEKFGIVKGTMTTTHSYTGDQRLLDASHRDLRRARAAAMNIVEKKTFAEEVNEAFRTAANGKMNGILAVSDEPLVSCDYRMTDVSSTIDSALTMVMGDDMVKVVAWYDNEWGYSQRVVDLAEVLAAKWE
eukprot:jgi/Picre1/33504/NNA_008828.t1